MDTLINTNFPPTFKPHTFRAPAGNGIAISDSVIDMIADLSDTPRNLVTPATELSAIGLTSLDFVELIVEMEKKWNLSITDNQMERIKTVGDAIVYVQTYS